MREKDQWKKHEPGGKLSKKQQINQAKGIMERAEMELQSTQIVKIIFYKTKLWRIDHYSRIGLEFQQPLRAKEIRSRMQNAFPELEIRCEEA